MLREINAALQIASTLPGGGQKSMDSDQLVNIEDDINGGTSGESDPTGSEARVSEVEVPAVQLTHHLNNILCIVSEKFTSHSSLKVRHNFKIIHRNQEIFFVIKDSLLDRLTFKTCFQVLYIFSF